MTQPSLMDCDQFIQVIMTRPELWNHRHADRKNKFKVARQWESIRKLYPEYTVDELKKRWKNLKDVYRKELKRLPQLRPGVPIENMKSNWRYFESLHFLRDEIFTVGKEPDEFCQPEADKNMEASGLSPASPISSKSEDENEGPSSSKRQPKEIRTEFLKIERRKMRILEEEIARSKKYMKSDNYHFLMSLLPEMDKLAPVQKMRLRTKISQAVLDEVSLALYEGQQTFNEVQPSEQIHFQEAPVENIETIHVIKEEAINMYD